MVFWMSGSSGEVASSAICLADAASTGRTAFFAGALAGGMYGMPAAQQIVVLVSIN
jgi:hypothetical protein